MIICYMLYDYMLYAICTPRMIFHLSDTKTNKRPVIAVIIDSINDIRAPAVPPASPSPASPALPPPHRHCPIHLLHHRSAPHN